MASRKYRLGDLLEKQSLRNKNMEGDEPLGVSIDKEFMPSVANTIGTDLSKYMLLKRDFFACNPMHVGRDRVLPIARYKKEELGIVSPAYFTFTADSELIDLDYLELFFKQAVFDRECWFYTDSTVRGGLSWDAFCGIEINIPSRKEQESISFISKSIARRIDALNTANDYLTDLATALFEKALNEETCLIPFGELAELEDSKRIPLNKQDRENRKGPYPYYGATSIMDFVDDYLFDGIRVLLGEDGSVMTDEGYPFLQYVWGKYWVNNHAHIIKAKSDYSLEALYLALRRTVISHIVTGAVQMKISQKNLNSLELQMPNPTTIPDFGPIFAMYRHNADEAKLLAELRDILLPKMMSDDIDVSKISTHWEEDFE